MKVLLIVSTSDAEICWNAARFGNFMLEAGDEVSMFLNGPGTKIYDGDSPAFPIAEELKRFTLSDGVVLG
jgi:uncharacterized protein involved in oxidation of intracellular sulfur